MSEALLAKFIEEKKKEKKKAIEYRREWDDGAIVDDVETLFLSSNANRLSRGIGGEVGVDYLRGKDVGLYFYSSLTRERVLYHLDYMCTKLRTLGINFELVFVCLRIDGIPENVEENTFSEHFKGKDWLASHFSNWEANQKLYSKFCMLSDPYYGAELVIIRPEDKIAHTYAWDIFIEYGIEAYPFSKSRLTEMEVGRLKSLTLSSLFSTIDNLFSWKDPGRKVSLDHLSGKNIIFFLTTEPDDYSNGGQRDKFIHNKVFECYFKMKLLVPEFEMVRVVYNCNKSLRKSADNRKGKMPWLDICGSELTLENIKAFAKLNFHCDNFTEAVMPWLEFPCDIHKMEAVYELFFEAAGYSAYDFLPMFVAFGRDGNFLSMTSLDRWLDHDGTIDTFFENSNLHSEVRDYIGRCNSWNMEIDETGERYIPR